MHHGGGGPTGGGFLRRVACYFISMTTTASWRPIGVKAKSQAREGKDDFPPQKHKILSGINQSHNEIALIPTGVPGIRHTNDKCYRSRGATGVPSALLVEIQHGPATLENIWIIAPMFSSSDHISQCCGLNVCTPHSSCVEIWIPKLIQIMLPMNQTPNPP